MDKLLNEKAAAHGHEVRKGRVIDMDKFLEDLDRSYACNLKASIEAFDDYETVSAETYNDLNSVKQTLGLMKLLGYLTDYEHDEIVKVAEEIRLIALKELEREQKV